MPQKAPRVSIGLPVFNGERFLAEALNAYLGQTYQDFELIICDNASSDHTEEICRAYADRDARVRYHRNETNLGAGGNYRRAFQLSAGEYFKWATYDDLCAPEFLARCVEVLDQEPSVVLAYPKTKLINEQGQAFSEYEDGLNLRSSSPIERFQQLLRNLRLSNALYGLMPARVLVKMNLIGSYVGADINFLAELSLQGKFWEIPEYLFFRRLHPKASSSMKESAELLEYLEPAMAAKNQVPLIEWRQHGNYFRSVLRAPLSFWQKTRLGFFLLRRVIWNRAKLASELSGAIRRRRGTISVAWILLSSLLHPGA